jgi:hypothetical protein
LRGSVAQASFMDELAVHPLQVQWLKACVMFYWTARASQHSSPLFHRAMSANVILSRYSDIAWCVKLVKLLAVTDVEDGNGSGTGHMDMGNPPGIASCAVHQLYVVSRPCNEITSSTCLTAFVYCNVLVHD